MIDSNFYFLFSDNLICIKRSGVQTSLTLLLKQIKLLNFESGKFWDVYFAFAETNEFDHIRKDCDKYSESKIITSGS